MVLGIVIYKFNINQSEMGEIEPEFENVLNEISMTHEGTDIDEVISENDRFRLFYNHTTGMFKKKGRVVKNYIVGRLKEAPYKILSYYHQEIDESQYLIISVFERAADVELYEPIFYTMTDRLAAIFEKLPQANRKAFRVMDEIERSLQNELKFALFQIERLSNLTKTQKAALIFSSFERMESLRFLREGPISREIFTDKLQEIKRNVNIDILLNPFLELNLVRRDWARGTHNKKTGKTIGEGEYLFLVKDIALIRKPPTDLMAEMKSNALIGRLYFKELNQFYESYDPFSDLAKESEKLAKFLLDPDIYDLLALLKTRAYPVKKLPNVLSNFTDKEYVLKRLLDADIIRLVSDVAERRWICLMAEITALTIYPEYLMKKIMDRTAAKVGSISKKSLFSPVTKEIATIALELLESTYYEVIEF